jgi:hypothetical protein
MNNRFDYRNAIPEKGTWTPKWWPVVRSLICGFCTAYTIFSLMGLLR